LRLVSLRGTCNSETTFAEEIVFDTLQTVGQFMEGVGLGEPRSLATLPFPAGG
jgi:hypothetical protein